VFKYTALDKFLEGYTLHITLEKTLGIVIALTLCAGIGIPLLNTTFNVIDNYNNYKIASEAIDKLDTGINYILTNETSYFCTITVNHYISIKGIGQKLVCVYSEDENLTIEKEYPMSVIVENYPEGSVGEFFVGIFEENNTIIIRFSYN